VRPALLIALASGIVLAPFSAHADAPARESDHPFYRLVEKEREPSKMVVELSKTVLHIPRPPGVGGGAVSALDTLHAKHDIRLDPRNGATTAFLALTIKANGKALNAVGLSLDEGLTIGQVTTDDGRAATLTQQVYTPSRVVRIDLNPALEAGDTTTVTIPYSGTLKCAASPDGGNVSCTKGRDFSYFAQSSVIPYLYDPDAPYDYALDALTRDIVLRVPPGIDAIATGEKTSSSIVGSDVVSTWVIDRPLSRTLGMYVFAGKLGMKAVPDRAVPTTYVFPAPESAVDQRLVTWSPFVLDFVEKMAESKLPFQRSLSLVRLPSDIGDPGTATFGMTLLSDMYAKAGDLMHEETWAHENAHLFWGIVVQEKSPLESRLMSEGLATLSELDYTYQRHFPGENRDEYLARRFLPIGMDLHSTGKGLPAVFLAPGEPLPDEFRTQLYTMWAYEKTSATLDHLRVTVGEETFSKALGKYVQACSFKGCSPDDFRTVLDQTTGKDNKPFFDRWVTGKERPRVLVGFEPGKTGGADLELEKPDDKPMALELWIRLEDGQLLKQKVDLGPRTTHLHVDTSAPVRSITTNPRHQVLVDVRSVVEGDLDFDGETDGFDILRCARLVGRSYKLQQGSVGLWNLGETFDPRCDLNGDLLIDDSDIEKLTESFGKLRPR
jgi:hypothetical protein